MDSGYRGGRGRLVLACAKIGARPLPLPPSLVPRSAPLTPIERSQIRALCGCDERTIAAYPRCTATSRRRIEAAADELGIELPARERAR